MLKKLAIFAAVPALALMTGCASPQSKIGMALINLTKEAGPVTEAQGGAKFGRACSSNILGLYASGDSSIELAKRNGKISKISYVDYDIKSYFVYGELCTIVHGE